MPNSADLGASLVGAWHTNCRVTTLLVEQLPGELWGEALPGDVRRTIRSLAAHLHNVRCRWIRTLGDAHGIAAPALADPRRVTRRALASALGRSERGIAALLQLGLDAGGAVPPSARYVWRNLPLDVGHVLAYFVAHEAHHRGQLILLARQMGHRLPREVRDGVWQWTALARASTPRPRAARRPSR
ncbi:MAG TPA: DinB family protein [Gemmatimonadaceae bacterium]|nr:DinB family protein [Gemmatimonadaceae bacterium]